MILLSARELSRQFDVEPVFRNVTFDVRPGERIGLVGPNGTGKTTLLRILAGLDEADVGRVERHPSADFALLEQEPDFAPDRTLIAEARSGMAHLYQLQADAAALAREIAEHAGSDQLDRLQRRYDQLQRELQSLDAYHIEHRVDEVLLGLGFKKDDYERPLRTFSGGQQNRALLARMLLRAPDLMLLDEPTNHLDIEATEWLEGYLAASRRAILLVSHDRYFLDKVCTRILELHRGSIADYPGNFSAYWKQREERAKVLERTFERQQEFIEKTEDFIRRNKSGQKHAQATDREKKLARLERVDRPQNFAETAMVFGDATRTGDWVIEAKDVEKGYDRPLFTELTLRVMRGDRVGILGPNGSGKTTLLRTLLGELTPDRGKVRHGTGVEFGYFDQQLSSVDPSLSAIEAVRPPDDLEWTAGELRGLLACFGVRGELALQTVGAMSGGEKSRVALARLAAQNANVLVLDEPTNHLDLWARDSLEQALHEFEGTIVFVSHDRYFIDRVATNVIVLEPERWRYFEGNYSDFVAFRRSQAEQQAASSAKSSPKPAAVREQSDGTTKPRRKRKFPYRKVEDLEADIAATEALIQQCHDDLANPEVHRDGDRVKKLTAQYEESQSRLAQLYEHWEEASELN